ncbi:hypothetical protein IQ07DRAFT_640128 [Pyrenochaeta sp. DS3sAY3a]|nr:hypothetical protein IQ07DRAFT_640128 [Pyrenochaeta sp. DS3sAY3a]
MDDHHYQPIWPMVQGAFDYIMNIFGEVWNMIWKPSSDSRHQAMTEPLIAPPTDNGNQEQAGQTARQQSGADPTGPKTWIDHQREKTAKNRIEQQQRVWDLATVRI